jgi:hypothetical protein
MESSIILAAAGQRYRFTIDPEAVIGIKPQITLLPANDIPVILQRLAAYSTVEAWMAQEV